MPSLSWLVRKLSRMTFWLLKILYSLCNTFKSINRIAWTGRQWGYFKKIWSIHKYIFIQMCIFLCWDKNLLLLYVKIRLTAQSNNLRPLQGHDNILRQKSTYGNASNNIPTFFFPAWMMMKSLFLSVIQASSLFLPPSVYQMSHELFFSWKLLMQYLAGLTYFYFAERNGHILS